MVFKIMNRLIRKRRFLTLLHSGLAPPPDASHEKLKALHFAELSLDPLWLTRLL